MLIVSLMTPDVTLSPTFVISKLVDAGVDRMLVPTIVVRDEADSACHAAR